MSVAVAGTFDIGGDLTVTRLGYGAMRIVGKGIWGPPPDRGEALRVLRRLPELGIDFIDTAEAYGPNISEELIAEALHPYRGVTVATKGGLVRPGPVVWGALGRPEFLRQGCELSLRRLGVNTIDLWQLHRIDPTVAREEQFGVMKELQDEGKVRHLGLSQVSVEELEAARAVIDVATVQCRFNLVDRSSRDVVEYCETHSIGFIPWAPLDKGSLAEPGGLVAAIAEAHDATPGQVALAWLLRRSPVILPIPGTGSVAHLEENVLAAELSLSDAEMELLESAAS